MQSVLNVPEEDYYRVVLSSAGAVEVQLGGHPSDAQLREIVEGPVRAVQHFNEGYLVLHGSCVSFAGCAVCIVGPSGAGKSTLAALLVSRGAHLISDGMTSIRPSDLCVLDGLPRAKLHDESIELLGLNAGDFQPVQTLSAKRYVPVECLNLSNGAYDRECRSRPAAGHETGEDCRARLDLVIVIQDGEETRTVTTAGADALTCLLGNVYMGAQLPAGFSPVVFQRIATSLQQGLRVKKLFRKKLPHCLDQIGAEIEREMSLVKRACPEVLTCHSRLG